MGLKWLGIMDNAGTGGFVENNGGTGTQSECILGVGVVVRLEGSETGLIRGRRGFCGEVYEDEGSGGSRCGDSSCEAHLFEKQGVHDDVEDGSRVWRALRRGSRESFDSDVEERTDYMKEATATNSNVLHIPLVQAYTLIAVLPSDHRPSMWNDSRRVARDEPVLGNQFTP